MSRTHLVVATALILVAGFVVGSQTTLSQFNSQNYLGTAAALNASAVQSTASVKSALTAQPQPLSQIVVNKVFSQLSVGSQGNAVTALQNALYAAGVFNDPTRGSFGQKTLAAIKSFQTSKKLPATGTLDTPTMNALFVIPIYSCDYIFNHTVFDEIECVPGSTWFCLSPGLTGPDNLPIYNVWNLSCYDDGTHSGGGHQGSWPTWHFGLPDVNNPGTN